MNRDSVAAAADAAVEIGAAAAGVLVSHRQGSDCEACH